MHVVLREWRLLAVRRTERGTGGDNAAIVKKLTGQRCLARAYPARWEVHTPADPDDRFYNHFAHACDLLRGLDARGLGFDPIRGSAA